MTSGKLLIGEKMDVECYIVFDSHSFQIRAHKFFYFSEADFLPKIA